MSNIDKQALREVAEITGRSIEEVGDKRLQTNIERNGWDVNDPEREDV